MDLQIDGLGKVPDKNVEYTSGQMLADYLAAMRILQAVLDQTEDKTPSEEYLAVATAIKNLKELALNGSTTGTGENALTYYMTSDMLANTAAVFKSLSAAGIDINNFGTITESTIATWQGLGSLGIDAIMNQAVSVSTSATRSLQSMIELEFVRAGNQQIATQMQALAEALQVAQDSLDTLQVILGISNQITVGTNGGFAFPPINFYQIPSTAVEPLRRYFNSIIEKNHSSYTGDDFANQWNADKTRALAAMAADPSLTWSAAASRQSEAANRISSIIVDIHGSDVIVTQTVYRMLASSHFTQLIPQANPTATAATDLLAAKDQLLKEIQRLETNKIAYASTVNSLPYFMKQVAADISSYFANTNPATAISNWIMDNQNQKVSSSGSGTAGAIQGRITQAVTAAQSLNDTEKAKVQTAQYNFQQFYQSASTVLQKITQIIEAAAQGISR